jgi:hypothetical protein
VKSKNTCRLSGAKSRRNNEPKLALALHLILSYMFDTDKFCIDGTHIAGPWVRFSQHGVAFVCVFSKWQSSFWYFPTILSEVDTRVPPSPGVVEYQLCRLTLRFVGQRSAGNWPSWLLSFPWSKRKYALTNVRQMVVLGMKADFP